MNDCAQIVVSIHVSMAKHLGQIALDAFDEHVRIDSEYVDERIALTSKQHVNDLEYLEHFALLTAVETVDDDCQPRAAVIERVNGANCMRNEVHFALQLEYEVVDFLVVSVQTLLVGRSHDGGLGRANQVDGDLDPRER